MAKLTQRDLAGAAAELESILSRDATTYQAASNLALVYRALRRHGEAVRLLESALERAPGHPTLTFNLGLAHRDAGDGAAAAACLRRVAALEPEGSRLRAQAEAALARIIHEGFANNPSLHDQ